MLTLLKRVGITVVACFIMAVGWYFTGNSGTFQTMFGLWLVFGLSIVLAHFMIENAGRLRRSNPLAGKVLIGGAAVLLTVNFIGVVITWWPTMKAYYYADSPMTREAEKKKTVRDDAVNALHNTPLNTGINMIALKQREDDAAKINIATNARLEMLDKQLAIATDADAQTKLFIEKGLVIQSAQRQIEVIERTYDPDAKTSKLKLRAEEAQRKNAEKLLTDLNKHITELEIERPTDTNDIPAMKEWSGRMGRAVQARGELERMMKEWDPEVVSQEERDAVAALPWYTRLYNWAGSLGSPGTLGSFGKFYSGLPYEIKFLIWFLLVFAAVNAVVRILKWFGIGDGKLGTILGILTLIAAILVGMWMASGSPHWRFGGSSETKTSDMSRGDWKTLDADRMDISVDGGKGIWVDTDEYLRRGEKLRFEIRNDRIRNPGDQPAGKLLCPQFPPLATIGWVGDYEGAPCMMFTDGIVLDTDMIVSGYLVGPGKIRLTKNQVVYKTVTGLRADKEWRDMYLTAEYRFVKVE